MFIQEGKSLITKQGIKGAGEEVKAVKHYPKDNEIALIEKGILGEKKPDLRTKEQIVADREAKKKADADKKAAADKAAKRLEDLKAQAEELEIKVPEKATAEEIEKLIAGKPAKPAAAGAGAGKKDKE